jgi:hypothetical protein
MQILAAWFRAVDQPWTCRNIEQPVEMIVVAARLPVVDFSTGQRRRA